MPRRAVRQDSRPASAHRPVISDIHGNLPPSRPSWRPCSGRCDAGLVPGRHRRLRGPPERVRRRRARPLRAGAGRQPRPGGVRRGVDASRFSHDAGRAIRWTREVLRPDCERWLASLTPAAERGQIGLYHGSPRDPVWEYVLDAATAEAAMRAVDEAAGALRPHARARSRRCSTGAAVGRPGDPRPRGDARRDAPRAAQPRLGRPAPRRRPAGVVPAAGCCDDEAGPRARFLREPYDIGRTQREIALAGLPQHLADRLSFGM